MTLSRFDPREMRIRSDARPCSRLTISLATLILLMLSLPLFARTVCTASPILAAKVRTKPTVDNFQELATWFADHKQFRCAAEAFASASKMNPTSSSLAYLWGLSLFSAGDSSSALEQFRRAVVLDSNDIRPHLAAAAVFDRSKRLGDAEAEWRRALVIDPYSTAALDGLSQDLISQKDYVSVIALLAKDMSNGQVSRVQSLNLGIAFAATARPEDALRVLSDALKAYPESLSISDELAMVLMLMDRNQEAFKVLTGAIQKHPDDETTKVLYLHTLVNNHAQTATVYAKKLLADYPRQWEVLYLNGLLISQSGDQEQARDLLDKSVSINPHYGPSRTALGKVLANLDDLKGAQIQLEKSIALGDDTPESEYSLARVLRRLGKTEAASRRMERVKELNSMESYTVQAATTATTGDESMARGDFSQATSIYREALSMDPKNPALHYKLSQALGGMADTADEITELERATQLDPELAEAQNQLGYLAARQGDAARAEAYFRAAIHARQSYVNAWINLAATLASEAKWSEAEETVDHALELSSDNAAARRLKRDILQARP